MSLVSLRHLHAFRVVAATGGIRRSSESLFRASSAVARSVAALEESLDVPLFERKGRGMLLTAAGEVVRLRADRIDAELHAVRDDAVRLQERGGPKVGAIEALLNERRLQAAALLAEVHHMPTVAHAMGSSQSALSQAVARLEDMLGQPLFLRTAHGMLPTDAGRRWIEGFERVLAELRHIPEDIAALAGVVQGTVTIGALPLARSQLLPTAITSVLRRHPRLHVRSLESPYEELTAGLLSGRIDFIIGAQRASAAIAACGLAATMGTATAQTNVQIYGIVDGAVEYYDNADAAGNSLVRMPSLGGGMFPSRLGFKGSEDLGNGLKAVFNLENGFYVDTGGSGQGNRLFGRQAWVGLSGAWGQLTFGRNCNAIYQSSFDVDVFGGSQYGLGSLDPAIPNGRSDNSIAYKGVFQGLTVLGTFSTGRDTSGAGGPSGTNCAGENAADSKQCREWSAMLRYDRAGWGVVGAYDRIHGGPGAVAGLNSSALSDSRLHVAGFARAGAWKIGAGVLARDNEAALAQRSNLYYAGATWRAAPALSIDAQVSKLDVRDGDNDAKQLLVRGVYELSKRTAVYAAAGRILNGGSSAVALSAGGSAGPGLNQNGVITGLKHSF